MKFTLFCLSILFSVHSSLAFSYSDEANRRSPLEESAARLRASQEKVNLLLSEIQKFKTTHLQNQTEEQMGSENQNMNFTPLPPSDPRCRQPSTCVSRCQSRDSNGNCYSYGQDFCGPNAQCVSNCRSRDGSGRCYNYGADECGSGMNCVSKCQSRDSTGSCYSYGQDVCGPYVNCSSNCLSRDSTGRCYSYGSDICY